MSFKVVFIAGATGFVGSQITQAFLDKKSFDVRILTRAGGVEDEKKKVLLQEFVSQGAKLVESNLEDVESLKKSLHGVDLVVSVLSVHSLEHQINLIKASKEAGVKRFVPSEFGFDVEAPIQNGIQVDFFYPKIKAREELRRVGLDHVIIITGAFTSYLLSPFFGVDLEHGKIRSGGTGKEKFVASHVPDFSRAIPDIATHPDTTNKIVYIEGDYVSMDEIADTLEEVTGKKITREHVSVDDLKKSITESKNPVHQFQEQLQLSLALKAFEQKGDHSHYSKEKITTIREYALANLKK